MSDHNSRAGSSEHRHPTQQPPRDPTRKRPLQGVWTDENGGPGPASWRKQGTGNVRGLARKKGIKAFWKTGFDVHESVLTHPKFQPNYSLPGPKEKVPRDATQSPNVGSGGKDKKCNIM